MTTHSHLDGRCGDCLVFGAIEGLADGLLLVDEEDRVFLANRAGEAFVGAAGRRLLGRTLQASLRQPEVAAFWKEARATPGPVTAEIDLPGGSHWRVTASPCAAATGVRIGRALLVRDVTAERTIRVELTESVAKKLAALTGSAPEADGPPLTRRERDVLRLLGQGLGNAAIAERLELSRNTIASHLKRLYAKIGVAGRAQAAVYAHEHGFSRTPR